MPREFIRTVHLPVSANEAWDWHSRHGAFERLTPPWEDTTVVRREGDFTNLKAWIRLRIGPVPQTWVVQHRDAIRGQLFVDDQISGPMHAWTHRHEFADEATGSVLRDAITWEAPLPPLGTAVGGFAVEAMLDRMFRFRHQRTVDDLTRHARFATSPRLRFAIAGADGLVGTQLTAYLETAGHTVLRLLRPKGPLRSGEIAWNPAKGELDSEALEGVDAVIHLAGAGIADSGWTPERKKILRDSRIQTTDLLARTLAGLHRKPEVFVSMSAVGWHGDAGDRVCSESAPPGTGFLAEVCAAWEAAAEPAREAGIRVVHPRLGPVMSARGGMLAKLASVFRVGGGGPVGSGDQYVPWISMDDTLGALEFVVHQREINGPLHLTAPNPLPQRDWARSLGQSLKRPSFAPFPAFAVKAAFGEMGREMLLGGQQARPDTLLNAGFNFLHPTLDSAFCQELGV